MGQAVKRAYRCRFHPPATQAEQLSRTFGCGTDRRRLATSTPPRVTEKAPPRRAAEEATSGTLYACTPVRGGLPRRREGRPDDRAGLATGGCAERA
ncbi:helix-turn-helix domain-containing protein [Micromonospora sp. NPDC048935]|uniref:helix-turn-helix domain-containing protein n=1 Tax=Micromonospora sp. NPDC048935 TaxID=3364262 RepID=UPI00371CECA1